MRAAKTIGLLAGLMLAIPAAAGTVAYVDYGTLLEKAPQVKASEKLLEQEFVPLRKKLQEQREEVTKLRARMKQMGPGGNSLTRASLYEKFRHAVAKLRKSAKEYHTRLGLRRAQLQNNFSQLANDEVKRFAKAHDIDLVVKSAKVYARSGIDITPQILARLRQDYRKAQEQDKTSTKP